MKRQEIAALAVRLLGLYCLVTALPYMASFAIPFVPSLPLQERLGTILAVFVPFAVWTAIGCLLLVYADHLGRWLTTGQPEQVVSERWTTCQVQTVAFSIVGIYLLAGALPRVLLWVGGTVYVNLWGSSQSAAHVRAVTSAPWYLVVQEALETLIGLWLFLGAAGLSNLWHRIHPPQGPISDSPTSRDSS